MAVAIVCVVVCLYATVRGFMTRLPQARRAIVEMTGVILLTPPLDILAGTVVEPRISRFALFPALLAIIPPLVSNAGALGGILSSRLSSKLHLGVLSPRALPESPAILDAGLALAFGLVAFTAVGVAGYLYGVIIGKSLGAGIMIGGTLLAGMIATAAAIVVAYYVAILTARFGLDPDNHSVPIITSVMDLAGVLCLPPGSVSIGGWRRMPDDDDQPRNVKDLLVEAKDVSELMVDLAYAAVFFNDEHAGRGGRGPRGADGRATSAGSGRSRCWPRAPPRTPRRWAASSTSPAAIEKIGDAAIGHRPGRPGQARHPRRPPTGPPPRRRDRRPGPGPGGRAQRGALARASSCSPARPGCG